MGTEKHQKSSIFGAFWTPLNAICRTAEFDFLMLFGASCADLVLFDAFWCFPPCPPVAPTCRHGSEVILVLFLVLFDAFWCSPFDSEPRLNAMNRYLRQGLISARTGTVRRESSQKARPSNTEVIFDAFRCFSVKSYSGF